MKPLNLFLSLLAFLFLSCEKNKDPLPKESYYRTVLVYLAADNNLELEAYKNMKQMEEAIGEVDGNLLVYAKLPNQLPAIYHIAKASGESTGRVKIKEYSNHNSSDPETMKQVIEDVKEAYPASTYGLILWSHATGWVPPEVEGIKLKSFGEDKGRRMDVKDLAEAIPDKFDFIMFDACSMASLEVLYEIKDKAKYFIASPGEVISNGMPYNKTVKHFFEKGVDAYKTIAQKYFQHYNAMSGLHQSATISVIDAAHLQRLADETKAVLAAQVPAAADLNRAKIQRMDFDRVGNPLIAFDFLDFMQYNYAASRLKNLQAVLKEAVIYKANTANFNGFKIDKNVGLTCYVPTKENENIVHPYYRTLGWYKVSGFDKLF